MKVFFKKLLSKLTPRKKLINWRLVHTIKSNCVFTNEFGDKKDCISYFFFYESDKGARRYEYQTNINVKKGEIKYEMLDDYYDIVYPWVNGKFNPNIPSYNDMDVLDVEAKLSV